MNQRASVAITFDLTTHTLYTGVTKTGKTTLARYVARQMAAMRNPPAIWVYDPVVSTSTHGGGWPESALVWEDFDSFMTHVGRNGNAQLFIDESADHFKVGDTENHWLARRGRHYGYTCHFISQRPKMIAPNVRGQCGRAYVFRLASDDLQEIAKDLGHDVTLSPPVDTGDFFVLDTQLPAIVRANVFNLIDRKRP